MAGWDVDHIDRNLSDVCKGVIDDAKKCRLLTSLFMRAALMVEPVLSPFLREPSAFGIGGRLYTIPLSELVPVPYSQ